MVPESHRIQWGGPWLTLDSAPLFAHAHNNPVVARDRNQRKTMNDKNPAKKTRGAFSALFGRKDVPAETTAVATSEAPGPEGEAEFVVSPVAGEIIALGDVKDPVFAGGVMGPGVAVVPEIGEVRAPFAGVVKALFPTAHAIGLMADSGVEILVHVGLDTVNLQGAHFTAHVAVDQRVQVGDLLIDFDIASIVEAGYDTTTPIVVTNAAKYEVSPMALGGRATVTTPLLRLVAL